MTTRLEKIKNAWAGGYWAGITEVPKQGIDLAKENKWKTVGALSILTLTAAYFMSPAYKGVVHKTAKGAAEFFTSTIPALHDALAASMPEFMGKGAIPNIVAGVIMAIAIAAVAFVAYKGVEKVCTYLTDAKTAQVTPPQQQGLGGNNRVS